MTVWQLASDWDEPRGPNGKTSLISRASRRAAQNRYTLTESNALDMNLHPGSWAPAVPIEVCAEAFTSLWGELSYQWHNPWLAKAVPLLDVRTVGSVGNGADRLNHALLLGRAGSEAGSEACAAGVVLSAEPSVTVFADVLPFTGVPVAAGVVSAAGMLVTGLVALRISRRAERPATPASGGE
jgi:hypothetical protein